MAAKNKMFLTAFFPPWADKYKFVNFTHAFKETAVSSIFLLIFPKTTFRVVNYKLTP